jgi:hypothetical protein
MSLVTQAKRHHPLIISWADFVGRSFAIVSPTEDTVSGIRQNKVPVVD